MMGISQNCWKCSLALNPTKIEVKLKVKRDTKKSTQKQTKQVVLVMDKIGHP